MQLQINIFCRRQSWCVLLLLSSPIASKKSFSLPQNGERCKTSPPHVNRWNCEGSRSSLTTVFRCWPTHKLAMGSAAMSSISKPERIVSIQFIRFYMKKSVRCKEMGNGIEVDFKKGSWLYLKPITKAHNKLCWESPLAVLMRIKRL